MILEEYNAETGYDLIFDYSMEWSITGDATMDQNGLVTSAEKDGTAIVGIMIAIFEMNQNHLAVADDSSNEIEPIVLEDTISININHPAYSDPDPPTTRTTKDVTISPDLYTLEYGPSAVETEVQFEATVTGSGSKDVEWSISTNDYLQFDQDGNVTFKDEPEGPMAGSTATGTVET